MSELLKRHSNYEDIIKLFERAKSGTWQLDPDAMRTALRAIEAPPVVTEPTEVFATDGGTSPVVKTRSGPFVVPPALIATRRAW